MTVNELLSQINKLSPSQRARLKLALNKEVSAHSSVQEYLTEQKYSNGRVCPHCGQTHVVKNGTKNGLQRYMCKDCKKSFVISVNTILFSTKKDLSTWEKYIDCMMDKMTLRACARVCDINLTTAFEWWHKILDALQNMAESVSLSEIIEGDECFFHVSYKGNHKNSKNFQMPRKSHKRGNATHTRGISRELVCVPCMINREGLSIAKATNLGRVTTKTLHNLFDGRIDATNSIVVTDSHKAYPRFAKESGLTHVGLLPKKSVCGVYSIQHINSYHSELKRFIEGFKGVSSKYLNNYLVYNNFVNYAKESYEDKRDILQRFCFTTVKKNMKDIADRPSLPFVA